MVLVMTIMQPDITKIPAQYRDVLTRNARRVVALQLTGVPEKKGAANSCCRWLRWLIGVPEKKGAADNAEPTGSRVGGLAFVTDDYPEPRDSDGGRMIFLAQLNLAKLPPLEGYPTEGLLQFFIADDDLLGLEYNKLAGGSGSFVVRLIPASELGRGRLAEASQSEYTPVSGGYFTVNGVLYDQLPKPKDKDFGAATGIDWYSEDPEFEAIFDYLYEFPQSVYGAGWATFTQEDPRDSNSELELLFQLDYEVDKGVQVMFGDGGIVNFFITREDLAQRNFHNAAYNWDCS